MSCGWLREVAEDDELFEEKPLALVRVTRTRAVVAINPFASDGLGRPRDELVGLLAGEVLRCVNASGPLGCGRSRACSGCSIRRSIDATFETGDGVDRLACSLTIEDPHGGARDMPFLLSTLLLELAEGPEVLVCLDAAIE